MRSKLGTVTAALAILLLSACIGTSYGPRSLARLGGGYTERQLAPDTWEVSARTNGHTRQGFADRMVLYRVAELASQAGFTHVQILESDGRVHALAGGTAVGGSAMTFSGGYGGESARVRAKGVNGSSVSPDCVAADACRTISTAELMAELAPQLRIRPRQ